ncbi:MAG TPA: glycoside hydrolase family 9 protein [Jatrophihabitantaceae bacterium]
MLRRTGALLTAAAVTMLGQAALERTAGAAAAPKAHLRVDQAGYLPHESKWAVLMTSAESGGVRFDIRRHGSVVRHGTVGTTDRGSWNATYRHTYAVRFSELHKSGRYTLVVHSTPTVREPIRVRSMSSLYRTVLGDGVNFYQVQRDGKDVIPGALHRKPSHLHDAHADVYKTPHFNPNTDEITDPKLTKIGGPVNVSGGWFDAGDFLKFTHTAAFGDDILLSAQRELGKHAPASLKAEAHYGLRWLEKMWRPKTKTLYVQVGTGNGTSNGKWFGDHDLFRLPQKDDKNTDPKLKYATSHRPVFEAAKPGTPISPNLAGRVAAAFALAAQVDPKKQAADEYHQAVSILKLADTASPPNPLTTALPNDFYPEDTWRDDMELGTAEAALAAERLHHSPAHWLRQSAHWAKGYFQHERGDTFNLYDDSALAHADLVTAIRKHPISDLAVGKKQLIGDLARQLRGAAKHADHDQFGASGNVDEFDVDAHTFGVIAMAGWYHRLTGRSTFDDLASLERDWLFGTNAWGVSFMVGVGQTFPHCMQHQVANLSGSLDGSKPIATGAVVNGPNSKGLFQGGLGGFQDGMRHCSVKSFKPFDGQGSRYLDDVRSWQTDEPALDMTGAAIAAAAAQLSR